MGSQPSKSVKATLLAQHFRDNVNAPQGFPAPLQDALAPPHLELNAPIALSANLVEAGPLAQILSPRKNFASFLIPSNISFYRRLQPLFRSVAPAPWRLAKSIRINIGNDKNNRFLLVIVPSPSPTLILRFFRSGRSISSPLFVLRSFTEIFECYSASLYVLFLDWTQAFDSISHSALTFALLRYGVPPYHAASIMALYHQNSFFVQEPNDQSTVVFKQPLPLHFRSRQ